jgi:hypothetical protein
MKPFPPPYTNFKRSLPAASRPSQRPMTYSTTRSTVLQSLLLCPDGGADAQRHGQGAGRPGVR